MPTVRATINTSRKAYDSLPKKSAQDEVDNLRDQLKNANTELNKVRGEKERFENLCFQLKKRSPDTTHLKNEVAALQEDRDRYKADRDRYKEESLQAKADYDALLEKHKEWLQKYAELNADHEALVARHETLKATNLAAATARVAEAAASSSSSSSSPSAPIPDRTSTKESRSATKESRSNASSSTKKSEHRDHRDERSHRDHRDSDRGRGRESDRDREKREHKEQKAEKERLSRRFEERRPPITSENRPSARRQSFIEGWGPGGRSVSANPARTSQSSTQTYTSGRKDKLQHSPPVVLGQPGYGANVPRTPNPLSPTGVYSNSGSSAFTDDDKYEDGNYHAYPIQR